MALIQTRFVIRNRTYSNADQILDNTYEVIRNALRQTKVALIDWIHNFVPKRTGQLRDSLITWINQGWTQTVISILMDLKTDVEYVFDIIGDVVHAGTWFEHSGAPAVAYYGGYAGKIYLDDPMAKQNWYDVIEQFVREEFSKNLIIYTNEAMGMT